MPLRNLIGNGGVRVTRRSILRASAAGLASVLWSWRGSLSAQAAPRRVIDVHCHVFNGRDIPARSFIRTVVFEHFPELVPVERAARGFSDKAKEGLADAMIALVLTPFTPTVAREKRCIEDGKCSLLWSVFSRSGARTEVARSLSRPAGDEEELLADFERLKAGKPRVKYFIEDEWKGSIDNIDAFLAEADRRPRPRSLDELAPPESAAARSETARSLAHNEFEYGPLLRWAGLLKSFRYEIVEAYAQLYDPARYRLALLAPAIVDFTLWLPGPDKVEGLADQSALMDLISRRGRGQGPLMHGYVGFDPLRQVRATGEDKPLKIARRAVENQGFLGVKLYPPMGFRVSGNAGLDTFPSTVTPEAGFGGRLDAALEELYEWCDSEGVAILAHTSDSQGANEKFGERADPAYWEAPLRRHPGLRVCLAHFGNFSGPEGSAEDDEMTWEWGIGRMMSATGAPNLYSDLSYFPHLVGSPNAGALAAGGARLKRWIDAFDPRCERLMFGTDWSMIAKQSRSVDYVSAFEGLLGSLGLGAKQLDNIFFANAVRYYGLGAGGAARKRLEAHYRRNGIDAGVLAVFD
ncbi:MAG: amidohydrolase family protein [Hyphomicrobiaceae bacterium]